MPEHYSKRTGYAPWSLTREAGVQSATVNSDIEVPQFIQPVLDTGFIDEKGDWKGTKSSDEQFIGFTKAEAVPNSAVVLFPDSSQFPTINCDGFNALQFALKSTVSGSVGIRTVFGPDTEPFANLSPITAAVDIKITDPNSASFEDIVNDSGETVYADSWFVWTIAANKIVGQANLQMRIQNLTGSISDFEFAFRRLVV